MIEKEKRRKGNTEDEIQNIKYRIDTGHPEFNSGSRLFIPMHFFIYSFSTTFSF